jgi:hypothetical protein
VWNNRIVALMEKMTVRLISLVEASHQVRARLRVEARAAGVRIWVEVRFERPEGTKQGDWIREAYDRALSLLDPA